MEGLNQEYLKVGCINQNNTTMSDNIYLGEWLKFKTLTIPIIGNSELTGTIKYCSSADKHFGKHLAVS
jgi:hypothetical protein